jgi:hypothetical protein
MVEDKLSASFANVNDIFNARQMLEASLSRHLGGLARA